MPLIKGRKGEYKKLFDEYFKKGYERFYVNEKIYQKNEIPELSKNFKHSISVIIDRIIPSEDNRDRLANSIEICLNESSGNVEVYDLESEKLISLSNKFMCPVSGFSIDEIEPRLFSFNNPYGACSDCDGLGEVDAFDEDLLIPDKNLSINEGAINYWSEKAQNKIHPKLKKLFQKNNYKDVIWSKLPKLFKMKFYMEVGALMVLLTLWMTSMMVLQVGGDSGNLKNLEILKRANLVRVID